MTDIGDDADFQQRMFYTSMAVGTIDFIICGMGLQHTVPGRYSGLYHSRLVDSSTS